MARKLVKIGRNIHYMALVAVYMLLFGRIDVRIVVKEPAWSQKSSISHKIWKMTLNRPNLTFFISDVQHQNPRL